MNQDCYVSKCLYVFVDFENGFFNFFFQVQGQGQRIKVKYLECIRPMYVSQFMANILKKLGLNLVISKQMTFWQILMNISSDLENSIRNAKVV